MGGAFAPNGLPITSARINRWGGAFDMYRKMVFNQDVAVSQPAPAPAPVVQPRPAPAPVHVSQPVPVPVPQPAPAPAPVLSPISIPSPPANLNPSINQMPSRDPIVDIQGEDALKEAEEEDLMGKAPGSFEYQSIKRRYDVYRHIIKEVLQGVKSIADNNGMNLDAQIPAFAQALAKSLAAFKKVDDGPWGDILSRGVKDAKTTREITDAIVEGIRNNLDTRLANTLSQIPVIPTPAQMTKAQRALGSQVMSIIEGILDEEEFNKMFMKKEEDGKSNPYYDEVREVLYAPLAKAVINALTGFKYNTEQFFKMVNGDEEERKKVKDKITETIQGILGKKGIGKMRRSNGVLYDMDVVKDAVGSAILDIIKDANPDIDRQELAAAVIGVFTKNFVRDGKFKQQLKDEMDAKLKTLFKKLKDQYDAAVADPTKKTKIPTLISASALDFTPLEGIISGQVEKAVEGSKDIKDFLTKGVKEGLEGALSTLPSTEADTKKYADIIKGYFTTLLYDNQEIPDYGNVVRYVPNRPDLTLYGTKEVTILKPAVITALRERLQAIGKDFISAMKTDADGNMLISEEMKKDKDDMIQKVINFYFPNLQDPDMQTKITTWANDIVTKFTTDFVTGTQKNQTLYAALSNIMINGMYKLIQRMGTTADSIAATLANQAPGTVLNDAMRNLFLKTSEATLKMIKYEIDASKSEWSQSLEKAFPRLDDAIRKFNQMRDTMDEYFKTRGAMAQAFPNDKVVQEYTEQLKAILEYWRNRDDKMDDDDGEADDLAGVAGPSAQVVASVKAEDMQKALAPIQDEMKKLNTAFRRIFGTNNVTTDPNKEGEAVKTNEVSRLKDIIAQSLRENPTIQSLATLSSEVRGMKEKLTNLETTVTSKIINQQTISDIYTSIAGVASKIDGFLTAVDATKTKQEEINSKLSTLLDTSGTGSLFANFSGLQGEVIKMKTAMSVLDATFKELKGVIEAKQISDDTLNQSTAWARSNNASIDKLVGFYNTISDTLTRMEATIKNFQSLTTEEKDTLRDLGKTIRFFPTWLPPGYQLPVIDQTIPNITPVIVTVSKYLPTEDYVDGEFPVVTKVDENDPDYLSKRNLPIELREASEIIRGMDPASSEDPKRQIVSLVKMEEMLSSQAPIARFKHDDSFMEIKNYIERWAQDYIEKDSLGAFAEQIQDYIKHRSGPLARGLAFIVSHKLPKKTAIGFIKRWMERNIINGRDDIIRRDGTSPLAEVPITNLITGFPEKNGPFTMHVVRRLDDINRLETTFLENLVASLYGDKENYTVQPALPINSEQMRGLLERLKTQQQARAIAKNETDRVRDGAVDETEVATTGGIRQKKRKKDPSIDLTKRVAIPENLQRLQQLKPPAFPPQQPTDLS